MTLQCIIGDGIQAKPVDLVPDRPRTFHYSGRPGVPDHDNRRLMGFAARRRLNRWTPPNRSPGSFFDCFGELHARDVGSGCRWGVPVILEGPDAA
jgi:hypothetical protein